MSSLEAAAAALPAGHARFLDFDALLPAPADGFAATAAIFGLAIDPARARAVAGGPLLHRYSKAPEYEYSPALRHELLAEARRAHGPGIDEALAWLGRLAVEHRAIGAALERAERLGCIGRSSC